MIPKNTSTIAGMIRKYRFALLWEKETGGCFVFWKIKSSLYIIRNVQLMDYLGIGLQ